MYTEIYEPLLTSATPPRVGFAYHIYERATNKDVMFSGLAPADAFIQKGNPVIPAGLVVKVKDLAPGSYRLVVQAVESANNHAPGRPIDFDTSGHCPGPLVGPVAARRPRGVPADRCA